MGPKTREIDRSVSCYTAVSPMAFDFAYVEQYDQANDIFVLDWNSKGFLEYLEITGEELLNTPMDWRSMCHKEDTSVVNSHLASVKEGHGSTAEFRLITQSSKILWIRDYAQPAADSQEGPTRTILGAVKNLTEENRIRSEMQAAQADFIYRASHELRTPLTTAILTADLLKEGCDRDEAASYWEILDTELHRQKLLVDRLLTLGRIESGHIRYNFSLCDASAVVSEAINSQKPLMQSKQIEAHMVVPPDITAVYADRDALLQVIINILNNAIKYSPPESQIDIIMNNQDRTSAEKVKKGVSIRIADHGMGIPPEDLSLLFSKFFRAKNAVQESIPGSGAGLYIVKSMLEEMGGGIQVESELNKGTCFEIWLPCG